MITNIINSLSSSFQIVKVIMALPVPDSEDGAYTLIDSIGRQSPPYAVCESDMTVSQCY
jgi:hypothetical protein